MQTIKTGVVVALLLAVCYGAFVALNAPEPDLPDELLSEFDWSPEEAGLENLTSVEMPPTDSLSLNIPVGNDVNASGGLGTFDASNLSVPPLPSLNNPSNSLPNNAAQLTSDATADSITEPFPSATSLPSFQNATNSQNGTNSTTPSNSSLDGPAVSLADSSKLSAPTGTAIAVTLPTLNHSASELPMGKPVSQPNPELSTVPGTMQLPLLNAPANGEPEAGSQREQPTLPFPNAREQALELASNGKLRDALLMLTRYYDSPELNNEQHKDLIDLLDALSKEVIYSSRHLIESPYTVTASDTIESLASKYQITPELLSVINGLGNSKALLNGSQIKVLPGPFRAVVSLSGQELTVFLGDLYAGRFPVSFGTDPSPVEGTFEIIDRRRDRTYYGTGGKVIGAGDNRNPYGGFWLNLGQEMCIHGTPEMASNDLQGAGCISLAPLDAADVYNILAQTSQVSIIR